MCIAILKPAGVEVPSKSILRNCWAENPQGGGFAYATGREVIGRKGYMDFKNFLLALKEIPIKSVAILHFRIATKGGVGEAKTHPFPLSNEQTKLDSLRWRAPVGVAHNGHITGYGRRSQSDTQDFISSILAEVGPKLLFSNKGVLKLVEEVSSHSRLVIVNGRGEYRLTGKWIEEEGVFYSNHGYKGALWGISPYYPPLLCEKSLSPRGKKGASLIEVECPVEQEYISEEDCYNCMFYNSSSGTCSGTDSERELEISRLYECEEWGYPLTQKGE